jgi:type IV pilus assembly protein PilM
MKIKRNFFYEFFPVPEYLEMGSVGISFSEDSLCFVELLPQKNGFCLGRFGEYPIPPNTILSGRIQKIDFVRDLIRKIRKDLQIKFVNISLPESCVYNVEIETAQVAKKELRESIELQLEEYVPLKSSEVFFDYEVLGKLKKNDDFLVAEVSVVPKDVLQTYSEVFSSVGVVLVSIETEARALAHAVVSRDEDGACMIIDIQKSKTGVYVVSDGVVCFVSDIETNGNAVLSSIEKKLSVSPDVAVGMKETCYSEEGLSKEMRIILSDIFFNLSEEVLKHMLYWNAHKSKNNSSHKKIEKIILAGTESALFGLREYLSATFRVSVEMSNVWENVFSFDEYIPPLNYRDSLRFGVAVGLALSSKSK